MESGQRKASELRRTIYLPQQPSRAALLAAPKPRFTLLRTRRTWGKSVSIISGEPSEELLSTIEISTLRPADSRSMDSRHSRRTSRVLNETIRMEMSGWEFFVVCEAIRQAAPFARHS